MTGVQGYFPVGAISFYCVCLVIVPHLLNVSVAHASPNQAPKGNAIGRTRMEVTVADNRGGHVGHLATAELHSFR